MIFTHKLCWPRPRPTSSSLYRPRLGLRGYVTLKLGFTLRQGSKKAYGHRELPLVAPDQLNCVLAYDT